MGFVQTAESQWEKTPKWKWNKWAGTAGHGPGPPGMGRDRRAWAGTAGRGPGPPAWAGTAGSGPGPPAWAGTAGRGLGPKAKSYRESDE